MVSKAKSFKSFSVEEIEQFIAEALSEKFGRGVTVDITSLEDVRDSAAARIEKNQFRIQLNAILDTDYGETGLIPF